MLCEGGVEGDERERERDIGKGIGIGRLGNDGHRGTTTVIGNECAGTITIKSILAGKDVKTDLASTEELVLPPSSKEHQHQSSTADGLDSGQDMDSKAGCDTGQPITMRGLLITGQPFTVDDYNASGYNTNDFDCNFKISNMSTIS